MHKLSLLLIGILISATGAACTDDAGGGSDVTGSATYRDAVTSADGSPRTAAAPPAQDATITVTVRGTGQISGLDPQCLDGAAGQFRALLHGDAQLGSSGALTGTLAGAGTIETPSGCAIPDMQVGAVTDVVVRAELHTTTQNCETYCAASARADAEAQCAGNADQASCRAQAEAAASASCRTTCTTQQDAIVAETSLGANAVGHLDADALRAAALGELHATLVFDHME